MTALERALSRLPRPTFAAELSETLRRHAAELAPTTAAPGPVIGVIADTHCARPEDLPETVLRALSESDLIVHCGDIGDPALLDRLELVAPVLAVRSGGDAPADGRRLFEGPRLIRAGSLLVGVVAHVEDAAIDYFSVFGTSVDVVLTGTTHRAEIVSSDRGEGGSTTLVNPGSPTLPRGGPPSVALVDTRPGRPLAQIVSIETREENK